MSTMQQIGYVMEGVCCTAAVYITAILATIVVLLMLA